MVRIPYGYAALTPALMLAAGLSMPAAGQTVGDAAPGATAPAVTTPAPRAEPPSWRDDPGFGDALRAWLLDNPEILYEMAARLDERREAERTAGDLALIDANRDAIFADPRDGRIGRGGDDGDTPESDIFAGGPDTPVFVEFVDYNCGFCRRNHADVKAFTAAHPDATVIIKEFPILGPGSEAAARAVLAVKSLHGMRAYRAVHNAFLEMGGPLGETGVHALLDELALDDGWDVAAIRAGMRSDAVTAQINDTRRLADRLGITGTPGFVFHSSIGRGLMSLAEIEAAVTRDGDPERENAP